MCLEGFDEILVLNEVFSEERLHVWCFDGINESHQIVPHNADVLLARRDVICDFEFASVSLAKSFYIELQCTVPAGDITCNSDEIKLIVIADSFRINIPDFGVDSACFIA